jgi:pimeloyl-ACP methyl ester carboxylesterase
MNAPLAPSTGGPGTWVLLRGLTREQGHWGLFPSTLQSHLPAGSTLVCPDLPGNGLHHQLRSPASVPLMAKAVRAQLRAQGLTPPYQVLAMSLGAMVTVSWAHAHPDELARCVLINTSLSPYSPFWQRLRPAQYPVIARLLLTRATPLAWEQAIMGMTTHHPGDRTALLAHWLALRGAHPVSTLNGLRQLWAATRYRAPPTAPPVPTLLLGSAADQLVDPACSRVLAQRWGTPLIVHPTAGHDIPQDDGEWVARQVSDWLGQR